MTDTSQHIGVQSKVTSLLARALRGHAVSAEYRINFLQYAPDQESVQFLLDF